VVAHGARDADAARFGEPFEACRDVHAVAMDVIVLDDDVAEIDADAEPDLPILRHVPSALRHALLQFNRAPHGVTTLANSTRAPSPINLTMRPWCAAIFGSMNSLRCAFSAASVPASSAAIRRL
jgi:hypothetical protein